jgi:two-component system, LytTR family, response regulator
MDRQMSLKDSIRVLVVDDEPLARSRIGRLLSDHDEFKMVGEAADGVSALDLIAAERPDLVFLDIQMPALDGLGVAGAMEVDPPPLIVFVTAFDRFAASAFDLDAVDYLLKPYDADRFAATLERVRRRLAIATSADPVPVEHLVAISMGEVRLLPVQMIERIEAAGNYAEVTMAGGDRPLVRQSLSAIEGQLPQNFLRIHRSTIIRLDRIMSVVSAGHGDARILLSNGSTALVSRRYRAALSQCIALGSR